MSLLRTRASYRGDYGRSGTLPAPCSGSWGGVRGGGHRFSQTRVEVVVDRIRSSRWSRWSMPRSQCAGPRATRRHKVEEPLDLDDVGWGKCRAIPEIATSQGFLRSRWPAHRAILSVEAFTQPQLQQRSRRTVGTWGELNRLSDRASP